MTNSITTESKPAVQSSQIWMNTGVAAIVSGIPPVAALVAAHPRAAMVVFAIANVFWRVFVTKKPIDGVV